MVRYKATIYNMMKEGDENENVEELKDNPLYR